MSCLGDLRFFFIVHNEYWVMHYYFDNLRHLAWFEWPLRSGVFFSLMIIIMLHFDIQSVIFGYLTVQYIYIIAIISNIGHIPGIADGVGWTAVIQDGGDRKQALIYTVLLALKFFFHLYYNTISALNLLWHNQTCRCCNFPLSNILKNQLHKNM